MGFEAPGRLDVSIVATGLIAGVQPTGSAMPQLLPDGLGPDNHLELAKGLSHPFPRPPSVPLHVKEAIDAQHELPGDLNQARSKVEDELEILAGSCMDESHQILNAVHPYIKPIVAKRNVAFMR